MKLTDLLNHVKANIESQDVAPQAEEISKDLLSQVAGGQLQAQRFGDVWVRDGWCRSL